MNGALVAYRNLADTCTFTLGDTGLPGYSIENLKTRPLSQKARVTALSTQNVEVDLGAVYPIKLIALLSINRAGSLYTTDMLVAYSRDNVTYYNAVIAAGQDSGCPDLPTNILATAPSIGIGDPSTPADGIGFNARYIVFTPQWAVPSGQLYREMGRLWIGDAIYMSEGCDAGHEMNFIDRGHLDLSTGEQAVESPGVKIRQLICRFGLLESIQAYGYNELDGDDAENVPSFQDLQISKGITGDILVVPRLSKAVWVNRMGIYGHLASEFSIRHAGGQYYSVDLTVNEER